MTDFEIDVRQYNYTNLQLTKIIDNAEVVFAADMFLVERTAKTDYLSGPRPENLGVVTGALRSAAKGEVTKSKGNLSGALGIGPHVWYGKLHEEGIGGQKKRAFLVPSIEDHIDNITEHILASIDETLGDKL